MNIQVEEPVIHAKGVLDLVAKDFKFDHAKGIAEWLKNSVDAYNLEQVPDDEQTVVIYLNVSSNNLINRIEVIDYVGMTKGKIDKAFKIWFDPLAAKVTAEAQKKLIKTLGGHGNGGKFYMREMFRTSQIITYRDGKLNMFGFNDKKEYGYYKEFTDKLITIDEAFEIADLNSRENLRPFLDQICRRNSNFTVVRGNYPKKSHGTNYLNKLIDKLITHPQAKRLINRKPIYLVRGNALRAKKLSLPEIPPKMGFEQTHKYTCPDILTVNGDTVSMVNHKYTNPIVLELFTSEQPLKGMENKGLNSIDFLSEIGVIASYDLKEFGYFKAYSFSEFIFGECFAPIMDDEDDSCVTNDREKFVTGNPKTIALLNWVRWCIEELCQLMDNALKNEQKQINLLQTSEFNKLLDRWKNRFMSKLLREQLGGIGEDGISGNEESNWIVDQDKSREKKNKENRKTTGSKGGSERKKSYNYPRVLIAGHDPDPTSESGETFYCDKRHHAVYQRPIDEELGIYWINTAKPFAEKILTKYNAESVRWRDYLFQRYLDIIIEETIYNLGSINVALSPDEVTQEMKNIVSKVLDTASEDLSDFLFNEEYRV